MNVDNVMGYFVVVLMVVVTSVALSLPVIVYSAHVTGKAKLELQKKALENCDLPKVIDIRNN